MFQVSVDETFSAGHALRGYKGKCENPHGHNYKVRVTLEGPQLDSIGLLYDFTHLKQRFAASFAALDHKYLNDQAPFDAVNPSAENIARHFLRRNQQADERPSKTARRIAQRHGLGDRRLRRPIALDARSNSHERAFLIIYSRDRPLFLLAVRSGYSLRAAIFGTVA